MFSSLIQLIVPSLINSIQEGELLPLLALSLMKRNYFGEKLEEQEKHIRVKIFSSTSFFKQY